MKMHILSTPREFSPLDDIVLKDCGTCELEVDEQLTFRTSSGASNDVLQKEWGFYLSNSLNANLREKGFKTALVLSHASTPPRLYLNLVEEDKMALFMAYLRKYQAHVVCWLDEWPMEGVCPA